MSSKFVLQQEDGTIANGNARGDYAVDLQMSRNNNSQVAARDYSVIVGGERNTVGGVSSAKFSSILGGSTNSVLGSFDGILGGNQNTTNLSGSYNAIGGGFFNRILTPAAYANILGGNSNTVSSNYSTISGGQSNTASTNTHATVVGGQSNTASGRWSIAGGQSNTSSGNNSSVIGGLNNVSSGVTSSVIGGQLSTASGESSIAGGFRTQAQGNYSVALGGGGADYTIAQGKYSVAIGLQAYAYLQGQFAYGVAEGFATPYRGNTQCSILLPRKIDTLSSAATTVLSLDGTGTTNLIIPNGNNRAWNVTVKWVAVCTATGSGTTAVGDVAIATDSFMFKKVSGTSSIGSVQNLQNSQDATMAGATCSYAVGGSQDLQITFTAPASANATTFRVVAKVELTEVAW